MLPESCSPDLTSVRIYAILVLCRSICDIYAETMRVETTRHSHDLARFEPLGDERIPAHLGGDRDV
jgi:hypothetical protein